MKKSRMVTNWDVYDQSRPSYFCFILIYCCSKQKIVYDTYSECCKRCSFCHVNFLIQDITRAFYVFYLYTLYMIGLSWLWDTVSMNVAQKTCCTPKKIVIWHPYLPGHNSHLSKAATFFCRQRGCCWEVWLYTVFICYSLQKIHCRIKIKVNLIPFATWSMLYDHKQVSHRKRKSVDWLQCRSRD